MAIDFRIRDFFHPVEILKLRHRLMRTQWLAPDELRAYQERRLRAVIGQAYHRVPFYRHLFDSMRLRPADIQSVTDLEKLPRLTKDAVHRAGSRLHAKDARRYSPRTYKTSGTSGPSLAFVLDKGANALEFVHYWRHWSWAGFRLGDRFAELGSLHFLRRKQLRDRSFSWQPHLNRLMLNGHQVSLHRARQMATAMRRYRPKFLKGTASTLYFFALSLHERGVDDLSLKAVFSTGEVLTPHYRTMIERMFHCPVLDSYGHMERTVGVSQCLDGGYHVNADYGLLELRNPRQLAGDSALADVVGTSLYNMAMPLIRYDVGDHIEVLREPPRCPCGRTLPLVKAIHGRNEDTIITPDGRFVTSIFIVPEFVEGLSFAQFIQETADELRVHMVVENGADDAQNKARRAQIERELLRHVKELVGDGMKLKVCRVGFADLVRDASGKYRTVISRIAS